tara:strand:+ start:551 stop:1120 length:570 start_codon:yes stop_codon:yes gene_type:complete
MIVEVKGKPPRHTSKEEIRAIVHAAAMLLNYHNKQLVSEVLQVKEQLPHIIPIIKVYIVEKIGPAKSKTGLEVKEPAGVAMPHLAKIQILRKQNGLSRLEQKAEFATILLHEILHLFTEWKRDEWTISTLTAKLKPDVMKLAATLAANTYQRAAWFAHGKISYAKGKGDAYNNEQFDNFLTTKGTKKEN